MNKYRFLNLNNTREALNNYYAKTKNEDDKKIIEWFDALNKNEKDGVMRLLQLIAEIGNEEESINQILKILYAQTAQKNSVKRQDNPLREP